MDTTNTQDGVPVPPKELHGKLVAWDSAHTRIVASGETYKDVKQAALAAGENHPIFEKIPACDERFVGSV
jgi:hypothetical protein